LKQSDHFRENADNCAQLAERAPDEATFKRYKRMETAWLALAEEQDWLDGEVSPRKKHLIETAHLVSKSQVLRIWLIGRVFDNRLRLETANVRCPLFAQERTSTIAGSMSGSQTRTWMSNAARAHSGNPAFRRPSINRGEFDCPPRAIHAETVKVGSVSSTRAAASRASASRPRWARADARQQ
jgi:hypothetical protein